MNHSQFTCALDTDAIIKAATKKAKNGDAALIKNLSESIFSFHSDEEIYLCDTNHYVNQILSTYEFIKERSAGQRKVRVFNPTKKTHGYESNNSILEIVGDDMPFLVDSITEALARSGHHVHHLSHPLFDVQRDKKGVLEKISPLLQEGNKGTPESLMYFEISHLETRECTRLQNQVAKILEAVRLACEDWQPMVRKVGLVTTELASSIENLAATKSQKRGNVMLEDLDEVRVFLEWLKDNNFVFLGYQEYHFEKNKISKDHPLGVFRQEEQLLENEILSQSECCFDGEFSFIHITKSSRKSLVHRPVHMDHITLRKVDEEGNVIGEHCFLGMFTSTVYYQSTKDIPIIRRKTANIFKRSGFASHGHSGKALAAILEDYPRDELFQAPEDVLFDTIMGIEALSIKPKVRLFAREDELGRFISCIIMLPRDVMSTDLREQIEAILTRALSGKVSNHYLQVTEKHLARLQIIIRIDGKRLKKIDLDEVEEEIAAVARPWNESFLAELLRRVDTDLAEKLFENYANAFSVSYTNRFSAVDAYYDLKKIDEVFATHNVAFDMYQPSSDSDEAFHLKVYSPDVQVALSEMMPILDNLGLQVLDEHTYCVRPVIEEEERTIWIHRFRFKLALKAPILLQENKKNFENALYRIWGKETFDDGLNSLILSCAMDWRQVVLFRAISRYLQQAGFAYSQLYIQEALAAHPDLVKLLLQLFTVRFDPKIKGRRKDEEKKVLTQLERKLSKVSNLAEDRVIRTFLEVILATLRTNFYQCYKTGECKEYVSFKINSSSVSILPQPRPFAEIYVYSPRIEGIHLRGGKVARGGLRWSDRIEDFRTEVLGLMKAQMTKNSVIIPVGSKGGFVVKQPPAEGGREAFIQEGVNCYKTFLRGLLDVTDNMQGNKVVPPKDVVRHDGDDPYLVVAADKGTATFSDIANGIADEYGFWLGDAFASGGSVGYDHKKMGITARGAWLSVEHHFRQMGVNVAKDDFTVVAIGDMAGDVFGNGMLCSKHIRMVAAFNHMHIFIDPNPDAAHSFKERQRLFKMTRSTWEDYNPELISAGGGVFSRSEKSIRLSKEIKKALGTHRDKATPDELIRLILRAPVDLLWNGGIGTYIKAAAESHESVGDKANDNVRVDAKDLRLKVVGEGGNLGLTQLGRIEFAKIGGRINTDSIDNSAGVDCSDHEVNIKIALGDAVRSKKLTEAKRNVILEEMTDRVSELVLRDNFLQNQALSVAKLRGPSLSEMQSRLLNDLENKGRLDRAVEFLPTAEEIKRRYSEGNGLTRPELSVILSYSKNSLYSDLLETSVPDDPYFDQDITLYFPERMRQDFAKEIAEHPLRREIIATSVTNSIINRLGAAVFYRLCEDTGESMERVSKAYTITRDTFNLRGLWENIEALSDTLQSDVYFGLLLEIQNLALRITVWFLRHYTKPLNISELVERFSPGVAVLLKSLPKSLPPIAKRNYEERLQNYKKQSVPDTISKRLAGFEVMVSSCDIVQIANRNKLLVEEVASVFYELGETLQLSWLRSMLENLPSDSYWHSVSIATLIDDIAKQQVLLTEQVIEHAKHSSSKSDPAEIWYKANKEEVERYIEFVEDLKAHEKHDVSMVVVAIRKVREIRV